MQTLKKTTIEQATKEDVAMLNDLMVEFTLDSLPKKVSRSWESLRFVIKEMSDDKIIGGIYGSLVANSTLMISVLYVNEPYRFQGYGESLLEKIEKAAKEKGARLSQVDTFSDAVLNFYQKNKYEVFATLNDCPFLNNNRYYMKKYL